MIVRFRGSAHTVHNFASKSSGGIRALMGDRAGHRSTSRPFTSRLANTWMGSPGARSILLTGMGILIIGALEKILSINAVGEETRLMLTGLIIVMAVLFQKGES